MESNRLQGYAAFGQARYGFTDTLRGTVGARFSSTNRTANGKEPLSIGGLPYTFDKTYTHIDWKVSLEKDMSPKMMVYGAIQTGYQPGTYNEEPSTPTFSNEVKPSHLLAYTAGIKSRWLDDRLQINDEVFYYDYRDLLIQSYNIALPVSIIFNASKIAIKGSQLDVLARVFTDDQASLNVGYSRAQRGFYYTGREELRRLPDCIRAGFDRNGRLHAQHTDRPGDAAGAHLLAILKQLLWRLCA